MEPGIVPFDIKKNIKKGVGHLAAYLVGLAAAWLAAQGFPLTADQQTWLIAGLTGAFGTGLAMIRNWLKFRWPAKFGWL